MEFPPRKGVSFSLTLVPCKFTNRFQHLSLSQMSPCLSALVTGKAASCVVVHPLVRPPCLLQEHFLTWQPASFFGPISHHSIPASHPSPTNLGIAPRTCLGLISSSRAFSSSRTPLTPFLRLLLTLHQICLSLVHSGRLRLTGVLKSVIL